MMTPLEQKIRQSYCGSKWEQVGIHSRVGINLPLSALHSMNSCGIGEFLDLIPVIQWCSEMNIDTIQLLPLNDSGLDPSPYNALSSYALHPIYLSLSKLPYLEDSTLLSMLPRFKKFNKLKRIDFKTVFHYKMEFLSTYVKTYQVELITSPLYKSFVENNLWIKAYALFLVLKKKSHGKHFSLWPEQWKNLSDEAFDVLYQTCEKECLLYIIIQYLCFLQLCAVKKQAKEHNILLKGDIPILVSSDSVDAWFHPEFFDPNFAIGAPPDQYAPEGQYWGFPLPKWDEMRKNGFLWWKNRLQYASHFYDLYRIDHVVGLFRLWAIPKGRASYEGEFIPSQESLWEGLGRELLKVLCEASPMLPLAEDLGTIPPFVRSVLEEFGICSTKVMRWERNWNTDQLFIDPQNYLPLSLTCVSTHDSTTLGQWWDLEPEESATYAKQKNWTYTIPLPLDYRKCILKESLHSRSLFHINLLSEYLNLIPGFTWDDPKEERINIPGTLLPSNWTYRFRVPIEKIISNQLLTEEIQKLFS